MAHKKAGGSTRNGRDSNPQYLGVKAYGGQLIPAGSIIIRQRGTKFHAGFFIGMGKDQVKVTAVYLVVGGVVRLFEELEEAVVGKGFIIWH